MSAPGGSDVRSYALNSGSDRRLATLFLGTTYFDGQHGPNQLALSSSVPFGYSFFSVKLTIIFTSPASTEPVMVTVRVLSGELATRTVPVGIVVR